MRVRISLLNFLLYSRFLRLTRWGLVAAVTMLTPETADRCCSCVACSTPGDENAVATARQHASSTLRSSMVDISTQTLERGDGPVVFLGLGQGERSEDASS